MTRPLRVLIVEDRPEDAELMLRELRSAGFDSDWRRVDAEADFLGSLDAGLDVILSDFELPRFNGMRALELLKKSGLEVPFIVVSGTIGEETAVAAMKEGAVDYLLKDRLARLGQAVSHAMEQSRLRKESHLISESLKKAEARYRGIFENAVEGIYQSTPDGVVLAANPALARILGYESPEDLMRSIRNIGKQLYVEADFRAELQRLLRECGTVSGYEATVQCKDGRTIWVAVSARAVRDDDGAELYEGTIEDITARKQAEGQLRYQLDLLHNITDKAAESIFVTDQTGRSTLVNPEAELTFGFTADELIGEVLHDRIHHHRPGGACPAGECAMAEVHTSGQPVRDHEDVFFRKDGSAINVICSNAPLEFNGQRIGTVWMVRDITERKRAEEVLRDRIRLQERITQIAAVAPSVIYSYRLRPDGSSCIPYASPALEALFGLMPEAVVEDAAPLFELLHPDDLNHIRETIAESARTLSPWRTEARLRNANGDECWVEGHSIPQREPDGSVLWHGILIDITDRKRAEEALRKSEERYQALIRTTTDGFFVLDAQGWLKDVNEAYCATVGRTRVELLSMNIRDIDCVETPREIRAHLIELQTRGWGRFETKHRHAEGAAIEVEVSVVFLRSQDSFCTFIRDITKRKVAEEALRISEQRFRDISEAAGEFIWEMDPQGRFTYVSDRIEQVLGWRPDQVLGKSPFSRLEKMMAGGSEALWRGRVENKRGFRDFEDSVVAKAGHTVCLSNTAVPIIGQAGELLGFRGATLDITGRKQTEEALRQSEQQLRQAQKMEAIGRLAGGVAHDFNNLLTVINGNAELAARRLREGDPLGADLEQIRTAGVRAAALTRQLLAFSRKQVLQPQTINLNKIVAGIENMLGRVIGEDIELITICAPDLGSTRADPGQIEQVVMNLAVNSRDAMPFGGKLAIKTGNVELAEEDTARHLDAQPGSYVSLSITDTGCGMDEAIRARIFEPFYTTKDVGKGTGLGLATVYGIVQQSGGHIEVESEVNKGTTFKIYLPRELTDNAVEAQDLKRAANPGGGETILLVEDEGPVRNLVKAILSAAGYTILTAGSGAEALQLCELRRDGIDLVLTDVIMPGMSGRELVERLAVVHPGLKVLYFSGYTDDTIIHHGVLDPGTHFIAKPFSIPDLTRKVREVLDTDRAGTQPH